MFVYNKPNKHRHKHTMLDQCRRPWAGVVYMFCDCGDVLVKYELILLILFDSLELVSDRKQNWHKFDKIIRHLQTGGGWGRGYRTQ